MAKFRLDVALMLLGLGTLSSVTGCGCSAPSAALGGAGAMVGAGGQGTAGLGGTSGDAERGMSAGATASGNGAGATASGNGAGATASGNGPSAGTSGNAAACLPTVPAFDNSDDPTAFPAADPALANQTHHYFKITVRDSVSNAPLEGAVVRTVNPRHCSRTATAG